MSSSPSSKVILVLCFSFRVEDSRVSLTFVLTCRAVPHQRRGPRLYGCPLA